MVDMDQLADVVAQAIDIATAPLLARITVLEKRTLTHGKDGRDGKDAPALDLDYLAAKAAVLVPKPVDGRDASPPDLDYIAAKAAALIPRPVDGKDGKDAVVDLEYVAVKAAALIPKPSDGRDGKDAPPLDIKAIDSDAFGEYVQKHMLPLMEKFEQMPAPKHGEPGPMGESGRDGRDGTSVEYSAVESMVSVAVGKAVAAIQIPKDGRDGVDGKSIDAAEVKALVAEAVAVAAVPAPKDGRDGKDADPIAVKALVSEAVAAVPVAKDGKDADMAAVQGLVDAAVTKAMGSIQAPRDGKDGKDGRDIDPASLEFIVSAYVEKSVSGLPKPQDGTSVTVEDVGPLVTAEVAKAVSAIPKAADGVGVADAIISRDGDLVLTFSDGRTKSVGAVVGANADPAETARVIAEQIAAFPRPKDGQNGKDGYGFDDMDLVITDEKSLLRFTRADRTDVKEFELPLMLDRGIYKPGVRYRKGSTVTAQGALWIAQAETSDRPGDGATAWRLAVKKGRDGRDGANGGPP